MNLPLLDWQRPNITEEYTYNLLKDWNYLGDTRLFIFPWATAFDYSRKHNVPLDFILPTMPTISSCFCATVCQHIEAHKHFSFLANIGITDLFWSHATEDFIRSSQIRIHPYPLYPVQAYSHTLINDRDHRHDRDVLYCFQGSYEPSTYLSPVRLWISKLIDDPHALISFRREWHFHQAIYREQIGLEDPSPEVSSRLQHEKDEYINALKRSIFSLCPSGTGPNSIRIWESIFFGAIPVIISDNLVLPGSQTIWDQCSIRISEDQESIENLPLLLRDLSKDQERIHAMRIAGKQIWKSYGLPGFVNDILYFLKNPIGFNLSFNQNKILLLGAQNKQVIVSTSVPSALDNYACILSKQSRLERDVIVNVMDVSFRHHRLEQWSKAITGLKRSIGKNRVFVSCVNPSLESLSTEI